MNFKIRTAGVWYENNTHLKELKELGFKFCLNIRNEFEIYLGEDDVDYQRIDITINSLEELIELQKKVGDIVICKDNEIIIYDGYLE